MSALRKQALELVQDVSEDKMNYVILILKGLNGLLNEKTDSNAMPPTQLKPLNDTFGAWEDLRKYKGVIPYALDEKTELAEARDEKHAHFN